MACISTTIPPNFLCLPGVRFLFQNLHLPHVLRLLGQGVNHHAVAQLRSNFLSHAFLGRGGPWDFDLLTAQQIEWFTQLYWQLLAR